jgi:hypothetical protein
LRAVAIVLASGLLVSPTLAAAAEADAPMATADGVEEVFVWGKREGRIGAAATASEGQVAFGAFATRPLLRPGELAEVMPGLAATQHSGSGKANQYFLRGFNLDHGTDFSVSLDGVPLNLRTHAHGQGYLDLNGVTPEFVGAISYHKGPYSSAGGDFSAAGAAAFETFNSLPHNIAQVGVGEGGYARLLAGAGGAEGYVGVDLARSDGPWLRDENLKRASAILRRQLGDWSLTALAYGSAWDSTNQVPRRAVRAGLISRLGVIDGTDGGKTSRFMLSMRRHPDAESDLVVYAQRYRLNLWANATYFLDDPVNGDQIEQAEGRWIVGGSWKQSWRPADSDWRFTAGAEARHDDIGKVGLYRTRARQRLATSREDSIRESSAAAWGEAAWSSGPLRATLGVRGDVIHADVDSDLAANSGKETAALVAPKLALAWRTSETTELYASAGRGFHSNDARGVRLRVLPGALTPAEPAPFFSAADGAEVGARYEQGPVKASLALWALDLESELIFVGDAGETETSGGTRRVGLEGLFSWSPTPAVSLDASGALTRARYRGDPLGGDRIPNALEYVITAGVTARVWEGGVAQLTLRRLGPAPLIEDNSVRSPSATVANLALVQDFGRWAVTFDVLNLLDSRDHDITYFYASRLPGEPAEGVEDIHFHPIEPRQVRVSLKYAF